MAGLMPKVLEEAGLSGELRLSGRKLKDFPKTAAKYNLSDTVIADLSRNRLCELPEDVTDFPFLETLLMYHNSLRSIPESIRGLHSLSFLDLRSNLLTTLPRELCFLPIQVLLVSNNRLVSLPDELGRMEQLTELDAACNQITHLPARMSDLKNLKSLSLRNNQLVYLPRDVTCLNLMSLDISCNRIASLPVELRHMTELVSLELSSNPLTSPPASLCVRGLVHVFKYLDTTAMKEEKSKNGTYDGNTTLRRSAMSRNNSCGPVSELQKIRRQNVDSGYSTSDGYDKRWSQDLNAANQTVTDNGKTAKWSPTLNNDKHSSSILNNSQFQTTSIGTPTKALSPVPANNNNSVNGIHSTIDEYSRPSVAIIESSTPKRSTPNGSNNNSNDVSPDIDITRDSQKIGDKYKSLSNIQTYREYKEALRQQRNQDSIAIYRPKEQNTPKDEASPASTQDSSSSFKSNTSTPSSNNTSTTNSPLSPRAGLNSSVKHVGNGSTETVNTNGSTAAVTIKSPLRTDKPVQKVTPSRNSTPIKYNNQQVTSPTNGNVPSSIVNKTNQTATTTKEYSAYVKPNSPAKPNTTANGSNGSSAAALSIAKPNGTSKTGQKSPLNVSWKRDDKLSFTMRREFDRQKEETELIAQLKTAIESRLKMTLPEDIASALTDGVVLCHLANHVRPRSVGSIHVPSPAVPKLTMARCRRNVDNFLDACRKIGVDETLICSCADIVPTIDEQNTGTIETTMDEHQPKHSNQFNQSPPNPLALYRTLMALLELADMQQKMDNKKHSNATNTNISSFNDDNVKLDTDKIDNGINEYSSKSIGAALQKPSKSFVKHGDQNEPMPFNKYDSIDECDCSDETNAFRTRRACEINSTLDVIGNDVANDDSNALKHKIDPLIAFRSDSNFINHNVECNVSNINNNNSSNNNNNNHNNNNDKIIPLHSRRTFNRKTPNSLDLVLSNTTMMMNRSPNASETVIIKKRKLTGVKRSYNQMNHKFNTKRLPLNGIDEECEYDSDIGKFICKTENINNSRSYNNMPDEYIPTSSGSSDSELNLNDFNVTPKQPNVDLIKSMNPIENMNNIECNQQIEMKKRIAFFEKKIDTNQVELNSTKLKEPQEKKFFSNILCLSTFLFAAVTLYCYPLPN